MTDVGNRIVSGKRLMKTRGSRRASGREVLADYIGQDA